jgi:hypothetical protein
VVGMSAAAAAASAAFSTVRLVDAALLLKSSSGSALCACWTLCSLLSSRYLSRLTSSSCRSLCALMRQIWQYYCSSRKPSAALQRL